MSKYLITAYKVTSYSIEVEADTADEAEEIGLDKILDGLVDGGEPAWQGEVDVEEIY